MNVDDIIRMAREAGIDYHRHWDIEEDTNRLARFAVLVAVAEREACARVAETAFPWEVDNEWETVGTQRRTAERFAAAIRARGEQ